MLIGLQRVLTLKITIAPLSSYHMYNKKHANIR